MQIVIYFLILFNGINIYSKIWFWEDGYHWEEARWTDFYNSKVDYIHKNPVKAEIVEKEEDYFKSSAGDYLGIRKGKLNLCKFG